MSKSSKPSKQRLQSNSAPAHTQRKRMRARCLDPTWGNVRSVTVRVGDTVSVRRGDWGNPGHDKDEGGKRHGGKRGKFGVEGRVLRVDAKSGTLYVEGVSHAKSDGKEEGVPIHPSNVVVTKLDEGDPIRLKKLQERVGGDE